jgi:protein-S-isoprenylcysteine O-methyltransferase Ste14
MSVDELTLRRAAVCASGVIYWAGVLVQARRIRQRIGRSPNLKPRGVREQALWLGWFLVVLVWIGQPLLVAAEATTPGLALIPALLHPAGFAAGLALVAVGYAGTLWTYVAMGDTWRIGINPGEKTNLVSRGPFRWVRHPLYAFQVVMLAGAALLLPTPVSVALWAFHYTCVRLKAADEEKYLATVHGDAYRVYRSHTGRLFPRWARGRSAVKPGARSGIDF